MELGGHSSGRTEVRHGGLEQTAQREQGKANSGLASQVVRLSEVRWSADERHGERGTAARR